MEGSTENFCERTTGPMFGYRHLQIALYFLLLTYTYCMRSVLSVAILAMNSNETSPNPYISTYHWTNQSVVLSAFFWGYIFLQVPSAFLGKKYGPKWILVCCALTDSASCLLIPTMADLFGSTGVIGCRFVQGLAQGGISPLIHTLLGNWAPPNERSRLATFSYAGSVIGNVISLPVTGVICSSWYGWPVSFYVFGGLGLKWVLLWIIFGSNRPGCHRNISNLERSYIQSSLGQEIHKAHKTPWKAILASGPFWAVTSSFIGANWGSSVLLTQTPTYLAKILKFQIKSNSLLSAGPYIAMSCSALLMSQICDWLINKPVVSRGVARKIFNSIGTLIPAITLGVLGYVPREQATLSVVLLILNGAFTAGGFCSFQVNHVDLSPNHSGILMGITNCSTSVFSIISPLIVQFIVVDQYDQTEWRIIFMITSCVYVITDIIFIVFASGEVQPWNEVAESHKNEKTPYAVCINQSC